MTKEMIYEYFGIKEDAAVEIEKTVAACFVNGSEKGLTVGEVLSDAGLDGAGSMAYCAYQFGQRTVLDDMTVALAARGISLGTLLAMEMPIRQEEMSVDEETPEDVEKSLQEETSAEEEAQEEKKEVTK